MTAIEIRNRHSFNFEVEAIKLIYSMKTKEFVGLWALKNKKFLEIEIEKL